MRDTRESDQLILFGHFSLSQGDGVLTHFSYDKVKALLVYLLLHRQPVKPARCSPSCYGLTKGFHQAELTCAMPCTACVIRLGITLITS